MSLEELLRDRIIERIIPSRELARKSLAIGERDLKSAKSNLEHGDFDWAFAIAYNAALQSGRAMMFSKGYRPFSQYKHVAVVLYLKSELKGDSWNKLIYAFEKMRKKRHLIIYEEINIISTDEVHEAIRCATEFVGECKKALK
ncbi:MAG: HEPN domain-containing protein [Candidatus Micrarchaeota archaeon]